MAVTFCRRFSYNVSRRQEQSRKGFISAVRRNKVGDCSVLLRINIIADITKGRRVMRRKRSGKGSCVIAFGLGLFLAYCFPSKFIIVSLAVLLVISGLLLLRTDF